MVIRRLLALFHPSRSGPPQLATLDAFFSGHASLTLVHIVPALFLVLLIPMFYSRRFGDRVWTERLLYGLGGVVGLTAYAMSVPAVGGWVERSAVLFFNSLFLFSLVRSYRYRQRGQLLLKRSWMTRAIAILLGIATTRPVMGIFLPPVLSRIWSRSSSSVLRSGLVSRSTPSPSSYGSVLESVSLKSEGWQCIRSCNRMLVVCIA